VACQAPLGPASLRLGRQHIVIDLGLTLVRNQAISVLIDLLVL